LHYSGDINQEVSGVAYVRVWYVNGEEDCFPTEGGETDALAEELEADISVRRVERHYDYDNQ
jgi:hypothetical protein